MSLSSVVKDIQRVIQEENNFIILSHVAPDGDNIGSSLAFKEYLLSLNKPTVILNDDIFPSKFEFLLKDSDVSFSEECHFTNFSVICLDSSNRERLGKQVKYLNRANYVINIDHHFSNDNYGDINLVDAKSAATCEIITRLFRKLEVKFSKTMAASLYSGILTDTGGFKFSNTTSHLMNEVAFLLDVDINPQEIYQNIFEVNSFQDTIKMSKIINLCKLDEKNSIVYLYFDNTIFKVENTDFILDVMQSIASVKAIIFARRERSNLFKISLRSKIDKINVSEIASLYGGGGHMKAAGIKFSNVSAEYIQDIVIKKLVKEIADRL